MAGLVAAVCAAAACGGTFDVATYTPMTVVAPAGNAGADAALEVMLPVEPGERALADPATLFDFVRAGWDVMVEGNQAGLAPPQQQDAPAVPLAKEEAWHHYQAGLDGVVDSARFLAAFTMIPSVQAGGGELFLAAAKGDVVEIKRLVDDDGVNVNEEKVSDGNTALHAAATMCRGEAAEALLSRGANPNAAGASGATPLMMAATMGCAEVVAALLRDADVQVDRPHPFVGNTALHFAVEMGRPGVVRQLCDAGADPAARKAKTDGTPLHTAADTNQSTAAEALLTHCMRAAGYSENQKKGYLDALMMRDTTALYLASQRGLTGVMRVLIAHGAAINFVMPVGGYQNELITSEADGGVSPYYNAKNTEVGNGATALHAATENGRYDAVALLLAHGARQQSSMEGTSPLLNAVQYKRVAIAELLIAHLSDDVRGNAGVGRVPGVSEATPLSECVRLGFYDVAVAMRRSLPRYFRAQARYRTSRGDTPLHWAVRAGDKRFLELLLGGGAGDAIDGKGYPQLLLDAVRYGGVDVLLAVLAHPPGGVPFDINAPLGPRGAALLHHSILAGKPRAYIAYLVEHLNADPSLPIATNKGTPLHLAAQRGDVDVVAYLLTRPRVALEPEGGREVHWATPLYMAAQLGHVGVVEHLLTAGAAKFDRPLFKLGYTPMFAAAEHGHREVFRVLLAAGAKVQQRDAAGRSMLAAAGSPDVFRELLDHLPLDGEVLLAQLERDARVPGILGVIWATAPPSVYRYTRADGYGALHAAVVGGEDGAGAANPRTRQAEKACIALLKKLRTLGAAVGRAKDVHDTPVMLAARAGMAKAVAYLLESGDAPRSQTSTVVHAAVEGVADGDGASCPVCRALAATGIDLTLRDAAGVSAEAMLRQLLGASKEEKKNKKPAPPPATDNAAQRKEAFRARQRRARDGDAGDEL